MILLSVCVSAHAGVSNANVGDRYLADAKSVLGDRYTEVFGFTFTLANSAESFGGSVFVDGETAVFAFTNDFRVFASGYASDLPDDSKAEVDIDKGKFGGVRFLSAAPLFGEGSAGFVEISEAIGAFGGGSVAIHNFVWLDKDGVLLAANVYEQAADGDETTRSKAELYALTDNELSPSAAPGDIIRFGTENWRVLDVQDGKALILSDRILERQAYNDAYVFTTWADCTLRRYLNGAFFAQSFTQDEALRIIPAAITNYDNPWHVGNGLGGDGTTDQVFLLSLEELARYFGDSGQLTAGNPDNPNWISDAYGVNRAGLDHNGAACDWWLRSPGHDNDNAAAVFSGGNVFMTGFDVNFNTIGVRPAMWVSIAP
jgi:hypothetical protein